jgi:hypothetical protein
VPVIYPLFVFFFWGLMFKLGRELWRAFKPRRPYDPEMN